jgi:hypothetical protein
MSTFLDCFSVVPMERPNKLECLSFAGIAILVYCFSVMPGAYPGVGPLEYALALLASIRPGLFGLLISDEET